jgi:adenylate cyclase class 2
MSVEIEAKMHVEDFAAVREALKSSGAARIGEALETNTFFDTVDHSLLAKDSGLRLRVSRHADGREEFMITFKGPLQSGQLKSRDEIEIAIDNPKIAAELLGRLGYLPELSFQKRRESWRLGDCHVELDEMPYLGRFIEIEGPNEPAVMRVREKLGLGELAFEKRGYITLLSEYVKSNKIKDRAITFANS